MIGFATDFEGESKSISVIRETLKRIAEAGFTHIHWTHEWSGDYTYSMYEMIQIREWMDELNLSAKGLHATEGCERKNVQGKYLYRWAQQNRRDYTSENELNRLAGVELIKNRVKLASYLGATEIVLHMQLPYWQIKESEVFRNRYYSQICKSFDEIEGFCRAKKVRICLENLLGTPNIYQREQFDFLFSRYAPEFLGFCFDTGHGNITSESPFELLERYLTRLYSLHLSDNHGLQSSACWDDDVEMTKCDEHLIPFEGNIDWCAFAQIVASSPYQLPIVLEVVNKWQNHRSYLSECFVAGTKINEMILFCRNSCS